MVEKLEMLGLNEKGKFYNLDGKKVKVMVLGLGINNSEMNGGNVPKGTDAYVRGQTKSPTSNEFPVIYLKKK